MVIPSWASTLAFVAIVATVIALVLAGARRAYHDRPQRVLAIAIALAAWLVATAILPAAGLVSSEGTPPSLALFLAGNLALAATLAFTPLGTRFVEAIPVGALVGAQVFRLPLELVLHSWVEQGTLPMQMTYTGHNFDIVTGVLALLALLVWRGGAMPRAAVWTFNVIGFALLAAVTTIAVLSSPLPFRTYTEGPAVELARYFPYAWIVPFCVGAALFGHLLVFRWLLARPRQLTGR